MPRDPADEAEALPPSEAPLPCLTSHPLLFKALTPTCCSTETTAGGQLTGSVLSRDQSKAQVCANVLTQLQLHFQDRTAS